MEARPAVRRAEAGDGARAVVVVKSREMVAAAVAAVVGTVVAAAVADATAQEVVAAVRIVIRKSKNVL